jgi:D-xylose transport system permease protein
VPTRSLSAAVLPSLRALRPARAGVVYALLLIVGILSIATSIKGQPPYLRPENVANVLDQSSLIGILAVTMTVCLITGNFDLSVSSTSALAAGLSLKLLDDLGAPLTILAVLGVGVLVGLVNGLLVQKVGVNAFIVTLGTLTGVRGIVLVLLDGQSVAAEKQTFVSITTSSWTMPRAVAIALGLALLALTVVGARRATDSRRSPLDAFSLVLAGAGIALIAIALGLPRLLQETVPVWILLGFTLLVSLVLRYTVLGRNVYAVGGSPEAARFSGINTDAYKITAFVLNGVAAAVVGMLYAGRFNSVDPNALTGTELTVIAAAILGGTSLFGGAGFVAKSVVGAVILFTLSNGFNVLNLGSNYQYLVQGVVLIAAASIYTAATRTRRSKRLPAQASAAGAPAAAPPA